MTLVRRRLVTTISLGEGQLGDDRGPDVTLSGYRSQLSLVSYGADLNSQMQMRIFGVPQEIVNRLTTVGPIYTERRGRNTIRVDAGDDQQTLAVAYEGEISTAWADYNQAPEVSFNIVALSAAGKAVKPVPPRSYRGPTPVSLVMRDIAASMGLAFQNNGVDAMLSSPYFPGTDTDQLRSCADAARINYVIERGILFIWPPAGAKADEPIEISPERNLIGYPSFTGSGVELTIVYDPQIGVGNRVRVTSVIEAAFGEWTVIALSHQLEAEIPGGAWISRLLCIRG